jgi:hypothetical protein
VKKRTDADLVIIQKWICLLCRFSNRTHHVADILPIIKGLFGICTALENEYNAVLVSMLHQIQKHGLRDVALRSIPQHASSLSTFVLPLAFSAVLAGLESAFKWESRSGELRVLAANGQSTARPVDSQGHKEGESAEGLEWLIAEK